MTELAIFDLDHTVLAIDCELHWAKFLAQEQLISTESLQVMQDFFSDYADGVLDFDAYIAFSAGLWCRLPDAVLQAHMQHFLSLCVEQQVYPQALQTMAWHREQGHTLMLATASNHVIAEKIGRELGFDHVLATNIDGNQIDGVACFADGKRQRVASWLAKQDADYSLGYFYSDSHNDIPLLQVVAHPICINPDRRLEQHARQNAWPLMHWQLPVVRVVTA